MLPTLLICISGVTAFMFSDGTSVKMSATVDMNNQTLRGLRSPVGGDEAATRDWVLANAPSGGGCCNPPISPTFSEVRCPDVVTAGENVTCTIYGRGADFVPSGTPKDALKFTVTIQDGDGNAIWQDASPVWQAEDETFKFWFEPRKSGVSGSVHVDFFG